VAVLRRGAASGRLGRPSSHRGGPPITGNNNHAGNPDVSILTAVPDVPAWGNGQLGAAHA
jgi:hypothetical protein